MPLLNSQFYAKMGTYVNFSAHRVTIERKYLILGGDLR